MIIKRLMLNLNVKKIKYLNGKKLNILTEIQTLYFFIRYNDRLKMSQIFEPGQKI